MRFGFTPIRGSNPRASAPDPLCPPKFRWLIFPSGVRSNTAPQASSSHTRSGASFACSSAIRQLFRNLAPRIVSPKWTWELSFGLDTHGRRPDLGQHRVRTLAPIVRGPENLGVIGSALSPTAEPQAVKEAARPV
jgi:hypothetical protein